MACSLHNRIPSSYLLMSNCAYMPSYNNYFHYASYYTINSRLVVFVALSLTERVEDTVRKFSECVICQF